MPSTCRRRSATRVRCTPGGKDLATVDASDLGATLALPYLQAVCSETLRIQPPVTDIARVCKRPLTLGAWTIPEGECVFVNAAALHRDASIYPEPEDERLVRLGPLLEPCPAETRRDST